LVQGHDQSVVGDTVSNRHARFQQAVLLSAQYRLAMPLLILIVVILFRPQGLLGRLEERTV